MRFRHFLSSIALAGLSLLATPPAFAWGPEGHEIVALIALGELKPAARAEVTRLLGSPAMMVHDSSWADEIRDQRPDTAPWHYVDIPLEASGYDARRDCRGGACVVGQIERDLPVLRNPRASNAARADALRFLIHFTADVHQPLHAEDNDDKGGNQVRVYLGRQRANLHRVWDAEVIRALGSNPVAVAQSIERSVSPADRKAWAQGTPVGWANEAHALARDVIYPPLHGRRDLRLPRDYADRQAPLTRLLLAKAGIRLAWMLNTALK